jgi:chemotaxis protein methyltransferase CheR
VGETYFFRDRALFEALEEHVLPPLIESRRRQGSLRLRLWSAGCASGEEPYSLAILLDRLLPDLPAWSVTILATDINLDALEAARRGRYREWSLREAPPWAVERHFGRRADGFFELDPRIRRMAAFAPLNLAGDAYPSLLTSTVAMDLVVCRNVLMYFTEDARRRTASRLAGSLLRGGWLSVAPVEVSVPGLERLETVSLGDCLLRRKSLRPADVMEGHEPAPWLSTEAPVAGADPSHPAEGAVPVPPPGRGGSDGPEPASGSVPDPASLLDRARRSADGGDLEEARRICEDVLARDRLLAEAHLLLAVIRQENGEADAAVESLRRAVYLAPDSAAAQFLLGSLLVRRGRRWAGRRCLETAARLLEAGPGDAVVPDGGGATAGSLLEMTWACLEAAG